MNSAFSKDVIRLFDQSPTFMAFLRGPEHRIEFVNPAYMTLVGDRKVIGLPIAEALPEAIEQGFVAMLDEVFRSGKAFTANGARYDRQLGQETTELYLDFVFQPIVEDARVTAILVQGVDVTERALAEQALIAARDAAEAAEITKADFISHLSHNIRAPMNAVVGLANILTTTEPLTHDQSEYLNALLMSADSVLSQVSDMVDTARIEARMIDLETAPFSPVELIGQVADTITVQAREKGLALGVDILCDDCDLLLGDAGRIRQTISQLASNAVQFTNAGEINLSVDCQFESNDQRRLVITVSDTGIGMSPEKLETLFRKSVDADTGMKRRYGGTGLGLSIAKTLCDIMGGTIAAESTPEEGSVFTVTLPLMIARAPEADAFDDAMAAANPGGSADMAPILLVEDYEPNILVTTTFLERFGYRVDVATNGQAAVEKARTGTYAMALMDVQMPGLTGIEATRLIREEEASEKRRHLLIVGVTAHSLAVDRDRCLAAGMDDFLPKPFNADALYEKISAVLNTAA